MRDIEAAYKDALIDEHEGYVRAGRTAEAEQVAEALKDRYGHEVAKEDDDSEESPKLTSALPETAVEQKPPENTAEPKPRRGARAKPQGDSK